jgi:subtilisin family serine protease
VAAAEWADSLGADVLSSSLAYADWYTVEDMDGDTAVITVGADIAVSRGIVVSTAAGNMGDQDWFIVTAPADGDSVIAVGAVDANNDLAGFSSHGPTADGRTKPEVVARGLGVVCACNYSHERLQDEFATNSGTSLAAPLVSGCAALVLEAHPEWTPMQVREALMLTADNAATPDNDRGWGLVDVWAAIQGVVEVQTSESAVAPVLVARPNPFRTSTTLVAASGLGEGWVEIHDIAGRLVWTAPVSQGGVSLTWDGRNRDGRPVARGVYVATLRVGEWRATAKLVRGD